MAAKKGGLGKTPKLKRGLDLLIPGADETVSEAKDGGGILEVSIDKIEPNPNQPRKSFDEDSLAELADSIKQDGILNPLLVRKKGDYYEIVGGERRWRASKIAGLTEIPVIVKDLDDEQVAAIALIDNLQRQDLNPIEEALAYRSLIDEFGLKQDEVAERVSKSRVAITNSMRLLKLDAKVQQMVIDGLISSGHARSILALPEGEDQVAFAERVFDEKLSVREIEKLIKDIKKFRENGGKKKPGVPGQIIAVYGELEEQLKNNLGTKVRINAKEENKGSIEIEFYSKEQLNEIIGKLEA